MDIKFVVVAQAEVDGCFETKTIVVGFDPLLSGEPDECYEASVGFHPGGDIPTIMWKDFAAVTISKKHNLFEIVYDALIQAPKTKTKNRPVLKNLLSFEQLQQKLEQEVPT